MRTRKVNKTIKYILLFIIMIMAAVIFFSGKSFNKKENDTFEGDYEAGIIEGNCYKSKWLGIQLEVPQDFHMYTREELDQRMKESEGEEKNLIMDMCASSNDMGEITIDIENCGKSVSDAEEYIKSLRNEMLEKSGEVIKYKDNGTISGETIAGEKYDSLKMEYTLDDMDFCSEIYARMINGYVAVIQIDYDPADKSDRDLVFQSIRKF
ncbi:MAG: hypothetical protein ACI4S2_04485 [Lachnospiraceae bacterium]